MSNARILVVDDELVVCQSCDLLLSEEGYAVETVQEPASGLELITQAAYDLVLLDLRMPGIHGMDFLRRVKDLRPETEVIMMTGFAEISTAVEAIKAGAYDYLPKPFTPEQLTVTVAKALRTREILAENRYLRRELQARYQFGAIIGNSAEMQAVFEILSRVGPTNTTVLIRGESGTGKELIARAIHFNSPRKNKRFVAVDCGSLHENLLESELFGHARGAFTGAVATRKGLFEEADGGTLFLDEIGHTSYRLQTKLLRVLQERVFLPVGDARERKTDARLIAATNKPLEDMVAEGTFREELFYRLNVVPIDVPPLRRRKDDIPYLALHFVSKYGADTGSPVTDIAPEALQLLADHDWPGNVRELENVIHRAVVLNKGNAIGPEHLPPTIRRTATPAAPTALPATSEELKERKKELREKSVEELERAFVLEALRQNHWNVTRAAAAVQMQRPNFQALMRKYQITKPHSGADTE